MSRVILFLLIVVMLSGCAEDMSDVYDTDVSDANVDAVSNSSREITREQLRLLKEAEADLNNGIYAGAESKCTDALAQAQNHPSNSEDSIKLTDLGTEMVGHALRGAARVEQKRYGPALKDLNYVVNSYDYCRKKVRELVSKDRATDGEAKICDAPFLEARYFRGLVNIDIGKPVDAIADFEKIHAQYNNVADFHGLLCWAQADAFLQTGKSSYLRAAEKSYSDAVALDQNNRYAEQCRLKLQAIKKKAR